jgi:hypothetical protein
MSVSQNIYTQNRERRKTLSLWEKNLLLILKRKHAGWAIDHCRLAMA